MLYLCRGVIPALSGKRVELRAMTADHAAVLYDIWCHPEVAPWLDTPVLSSIADAECLVAMLQQMAHEEESLRWSIIGPEGEVIGSCGYNYWQLPGAYRGEIGCELSPSHWGQGYMQEALELVLDFGFSIMGLNRIEALCHRDNVRAERLFQALDFRQEGLLRQYRHTPSGFQDIALYALLQSERAND
jgi:ribosomal-protein-alanine N-acetyltransferase